MLPLATFSTITDWIWGQLTDYLSREKLTIQVSSTMATLVIKIQNRGFSVLSIRTEKIVLNGAWLFCFFFGQAKKEEKNPFEEFSILNTQP